MSMLQEVLDTCAALTRRVEHLEHDKVAQNLEITKLKTRVKKLERANKIKTLKLRRLRKVGTSWRVDTSNDTVMKDVSNQGRMIDELDKDEGAVLMNEKEETKEVKDIIEEEPEIQEVVEVVTTAKLITEVVAAVSETVSVAVVVPTVTSVVVPTVTVAPVKVTVPSTKQRREVVIRDPKEESSAKTPTETKSKDKGKGIMVEESKPMKKKQQVELDEAYARKLHEELNKYIDWEVEIDHVKQKAKGKPVCAEIPDDEEKASDRSSSSKKYDKSIVKERFSTSKPNNFSDDFLLTTLRAMIGRPDGQDQVWMSQRSIHGQAKVKSWKLLESCGVHIVALTTTQLIMLVERRYPLSRFTLDQMLNAVRLRVEEQSEMSLELIRFTRQ
uniref:Uncharacterized protein n=1 Tax=Tanacetum cinerariifolium TaxID=118510 RepID=A0A6L2JCP8_TANCI|nr:hypothetical protein [Tanacetum cinerariifolium]